MKSIVFRLVLHTAIVLFVLAAATSVTLAQSGGSVTGCLNPGGYLGKIAIGTVPAQQCAPNERQVTLSRGNTGTPASYIGLDRGTEQVIATAGPLTLTAKCFVDGASGAMFTQVYMSSMVSNWSANGPVSPLPNTFGTEAFAFAFIPVPLVKTNGAISLAADGHYLTFTGVMVGVNFDGRDCVVMGTVHKAQRAP